MTEGLSVTSTADVFAVVAGLYGLDVEEVRRPSRQPQRERARRLAARLLYDECHLSWQGVAHALGLAWASGSLIETARRADRRHLAAARRRLAEVAS